MPYRRVHLNKTLCDFAKDNPVDIIIYRFIPIEYLLNLIRTESLWISQTKLWDDTYENFLANAKYQYGKTPISYSGFTPTFYGQCWTVKEESDALWRIYSPNKMGVRIKSTIERLGQVCLNETDYKPFSTRRIQIGKVDYLTSLEIQNWIETQKTPFINDISLVNSLFIKRKEFEHENEVRLIIHKNADREEESRGIEKRKINLEINPNELIEQITFDPRLNKETYITYKLILENMGFVNEINKSNMYSYNHYQIEM